MNRKLNLFSSFFCLLVILLCSCDSNSVNYNISHEPQLIFETPFVRALEFDPQGNLWFSAGYHLYKLDDEILEFHSENSKLSDNIAIYDIESDTKGNLWFGTNCGLMEYSAGEFKLYDSTKAAVRGNIFDVEVDKENNIWYAGQNGLTKLNHETHNTYKPEYFDVVYLFAQGMKVDSQNNLWLSVGRFLYKINDQECEKFENDQLYNCQNIAIDKNDHIWLTCDYSISSMAYTEEMPKIMIYNGNKWTAKNPRIMIENIFHPWKMISDSRGLIWICSAHDLFYFDGDSWNFIKIGRAVWDLCEDSRGNIWLGTSDGIYLLEIRE
ncbi:MAG: hypothetical protein JXQ65_05505 [Candidatus Marinimicrobia bacterium]|nr:hypothetical protein [Candidatus Neomarinimicrobiota bacterium]